MSLIQLFVASSRFEFFFSTRQQELPLVALPPQEKIKFITDKIYEYMGERRKKSIDELRKYWKGKNWKKKSLQKLGNADLSVK